MIRFTGSCSETSGTAAALTSQRVSSCQLPVLRDVAAVPEKEDASNPIHDAHNSFWGQLLADIYPVVKIMQIQVFVICIPFQLKTNSGFYAD